jgi:hypothetical protein
MKRFTDTQKKWALTATMIALLGCSVSFNSNNTGNSSVDLASESEELMVPTNVKIGKEDIKVRLIKMSDKETTVVLPPQKNSEGKVLFECADCSTFVLNKKLRNDSDTIAEFQAEIVKKWTNTKEEKKEIVKAASDVKEERKTGGRRERIAKEDRDEDLRSDVDDEAADLASYVDEKCLGKSAKDSDRRERRNSKSVSCVSKYFLDYVKKYEISESVTAKYYQKMIEPKILNRIRDGIRSQTEDGLDSSDEAFETITTLLQELPTESSLLRKAIVMTSTKAVTKSASTARQMVAQATATHRTSDLAAAIDQINATGSLADNLSIMNQDALFNLNGDNNISMSEARNIYSSAYGRIAQDVKTGMMKWIPVQAMSNPNAVNVNAYQVPVIGNDMRIGYATELGQGVLAAPGSNNNSNWGNNNLLNGQQNNNGVLIAPQQLQQNTSNGTQFGQPRAVTPEAMRAAQNIRSQQGQAIWVQQ